MKNFRAYSIAILLALTAASTRGATPAPKPDADPLIEQLKSGTNASRIEALKKLADLGLPAAAPINKAWDAVAPVRPALPRSFARNLRANLNGERDLYAAWFMINGPYGQAMILPGKNGGWTFMKQFNEAQQARPFAKVAAGQNDMEIIQQLTAYPFMPIVNNGLQEAVVSLINHHNDAVRRAALQSLSLYANVKIPADKLLALINCNDPLIAGPAAVILARQGDDPKLAELLAVAKSKPAAWDSIADLLCYCDRVQVTRILKPLLEDSDWHAKLFSAGCLLALKENTADAEKVLLELFANRGHEIKMEAAWILYELGSDDARKDVIRGLYDQRKPLSQIYLGVSDWLGSKPDIKKRADAAATAFLNNRVAGVQNGFMESGQYAIDLRDAVRLGFAEKVRAKLKTELGKMIDVPPAPVGKAPAKVVAKSVDRYVYSIMATVLSELDPGEYRKEISRCVEVIASRQLGSGMWSYRDPTAKERDDYRDGYSQANPSDFELPQAFYAVCGLESAKVHGEVPVDTEIFIKALRGILYTQNLDGSFSNYPQPSPRVLAGAGRADLTAWGLGVVATCVRNGLLDIEQDPDLLARALIGREAARLLLVKHAAAHSDPAATNENGLSGAYPLRELAFTFGNDGLLGAGDYASLERPMAYGGGQLYCFGFPEPPDSTSPPWIDEPVIEAKTKPAGGQQPNR